MKVNPAVTFSCLAILGLALVAGCKTTPAAVDWSSRVGHCTYNQAVLELGPPEKQTSLADGKTVVQWITLHSRTAASFGSSFAAGNYGYGMGLRHTYPNHVLELTFGTNDVLQSWSKNY